MTDPLFDTLFRPTTVPAAIASAAPVRVLGTRTRAGNSMARTRAALLEGTGRAVQVSGTKITMSQVATAAGVAKATLYNHFRTREALLAALVLDEVTAIVEGCAGLPVADALAAAANALAEHPVLRALAEIEPATLAELGRIDDAAEGWRLARTAVVSALAADLRGGAELVLRWLASYLLSPANAESIAADLAILLVALPDLPVAEAEITSLGA
ncbi:helix-turn-helix domain-containing protein [Jatrophihabitans sp.]|uniref:TetR/AcrR family transcriptional regulator n=1 Tax=Jatrophihabitans sp. TaxID=1932789 RepID=UPI0030C6DED3|nr:transcriptional regulator, TetR family [Jatrophihabitans sp.]